MADLLKLGVLISGNGSNLQSIIDHIEKGSLKAAIKIVISNNPDAYGITRAEKHGIPFLVLKNGDFKNKEDFDAELVKILKDNDFIREADDLHSVLQVDLFIAVLGGKVEVKTFKGKIKLDIPKETNNDKILRLPKMGMPKYGSANEYGDLYFKIEVQIPQKLSEKEISLFKELQKIRNK